MNKVDEVIEVIESFMLDNQHIAIRNEGACISFVKNEKEPSIEAICNMCFGYLMNIIPQEDGGYQMVPMEHAVEGGSLEEPCIPVVTIQDRILVHLEKESTVPDHCIVFSLSDANDPDYQQKCDHNHEDSCDHCEALKETMLEIESCINRCHIPSDDDRDEARYIIQSSKLAIQSWQCHILRSFNQDQARLDILGILDHETVLIVNDWAMKFLPQRYRESQSDWFGKRGISWHISVAYRRSNELLQWQGFIHVIQSCSQDSRSVIKIMQDVLCTIKDEYPEITKANFHKDNAGCYHSSATILACPVISQSSGVNIMRIDFSDPQGGKGAADRLAATCKAHVRAFINEGHDVTNASQLKDALVSHGGIAGVRVTCMKTIGIEGLAVTETKIQNVSKLNNFEFKDKSSIREWRAFRVGNGKVFNSNTSSAGEFKSLGSKDKAEPLHAHDEFPKTKESSSGSLDCNTSQAIYTCPENGCTRVFQRHSALVRHMSSEKCTRSLEKHTLLDLAKLGRSFMLQPVVLKCGHTFCRECLKTLAAQPVANRKCPICRGEVDKNSLPINVDLLAVMSSIPAKCTLCAWEGRVEDVMVHSSMCSMKGRMCSMKGTPCVFPGCSFRCLGKDMPEHKRACSFRTVTCNECKITNANNVVTENYRVHSIGMATMPTMSRGK
ncbi:hypothetical protein QZH41_003630 [Actinostola sp. cb2023]|nr:hypothetical protein QZH41_003630 [Actinostola sp. cb2023]